MKNTATLATALFALGSVATEQLTPEKVEADIKTSEYVANPNLIYIYISNMLID